MVADLSLNKFVIAGGNFNAKEIVSFVELSKHLLVTVLNSKNANTVYSSPLKLHVHVFTYPSCPSSCYLDQIKNG